MAQKGPVISGMSKSCFVAQIPKELIEKFKNDLIEQGFDLKTGPYLIFHAAKRGVQVHLYESLKLTVMGKEKDDFILYYLEPEILKSLSYSHPHHEADRSAHMGSDEAGKGDYFGPLCVVCVSCTCENIEQLIKLDVQDSKNLSDDKVHLLAEKLKKQIYHELVILYPKTYNELYLKFKNLNRMLAWAHTTAISNLYARVPQPFVIVDQFAKDQPVKRSLRKSLPTLEVIEKTKAEADLVVAAASILARDAFLTGLKKLSEKADFELPKGASSLVVKAARQLVNRSGKEILNSVAKTHFKTTLEL